MQKTYAKKTKMSKQLNENFTFNMFQLRSSLRLLLYIVLIITFLKILIKHVESKIFIQLFGHFCLFIQSTTCN